ncbi:hypothetical protein LZD49_12515 [Dyadobacter sp. CY261]|uniref:hypothetical protein n=1 Tax=Dyadobacter sp. CY261 TaxID=2907203 RepID=UPI001F427920|nr:hypothetical protein [Dyadobacter sp. CY261]MCF0071296.1 hypothetical protein [Dyadobacter sp. CY261]
MDDIISELCELPTGVYTLEFLPRHEISHWEGIRPIPLNRWYGIAVFKDSLEYDQPAEGTVHGAINRVSIGCMVVNDSQAIADQVQQMEQMRFALRVTHYDGKIRIVGTPNELVTLTTSQFKPPKIVGAQGYTLNFTGSFIAKPAILTL